MILSVRLEAVASFLRSVTLYDVGTDHAYLPIRAMLRPGIPCAYASDIRNGPLKTAQKNIEKAGLTDRIFLSSKDGLNDTILICPCDVVIAGMGGELISHIVSGNEGLKNSDNMLILQPMTKPEYLRYYLANNGFSVIHELAVPDGKKIYEIIVASYSGAKLYISRAEALVGKIENHDDKDSFIKLVTKKCIQLKRNISGKKTAGLDVTDDCIILKELEQLIKGL